MQTKNLKKKGFTLVELVIVVAVIAVLSAILIPTIGCFVEQAKETKDMTTVKTLNTVLVEDEAKNGKPELFRDALKVVEEKGYNVEKLTPLSTGDILWDSKNNRFALYKDGDPVYRDNSTAECADVEFWMIATAKTGLSEKYSNYLKDGETFFTFPDKVYTGLDVGDHYEIKNINYIAKDGRTDGQTAIFYTNGGTLTVNASKDTVKHYNQADYVNIIAVNTASYHEYGIVAGNIDVAAGHVVIENGGKANGINITAETITKTDGKYNVSVTIADSADIKYVTSVVTIADGENVISAPESVKTIDKSTIPTDAVFYNLTKDTYKDSNSFYYSSAEKDCYFVLLKDITDDYIKVINSITIDLNGHSVKANADNKCEGALRVLGHNKLYDTTQFVKIVGSGLLEMTGSYNGYDCAVSIGRANDYISPINLYIGEGITLKGTTGIALMDSKSMAYKNVTVDLAGKIEQNGAGAGIYVNGTYQEAEQCPTFIIRKSASVVSTSEGSSAIYAAGYANWTIEGGYFEGRECIEIKAGNLVINDGTFVATGEKEHTPSTGAASAIGYSVAIVNNNNYAKPLTVNILGGVFKNDVEILEDQELSENKASLIISGGSFVNDVSAYRQ